MGYYNLGYAYALQGDLEEAAWAFRQATKMNPKFSVAFNNLSWCLWQLGKYAEAIEMLERAVVVDTKSLDALLNLGMVYAATGRYEDARKKFEQMLEVAPDYSEAQNYLEKVEKILQEKKGKKKEEEKEK